MVFSGSIDAPLRCNSCKWASCGGDVFYGGRYHGYSARWGRCFGLQGAASREAEGVIGIYGDLLDNSHSNPWHGPSPSQPRIGAYPAPSTALVQRTTKTGERKSASSVALPYPITIEAPGLTAKRTRVPGSYVCTWEGCGECECTHQLPFRS
jgi:hypothetical protein